MAQPRGHCRPLAVLIFVDTLSRFTDPLRGICTITKCMIQLVVEVQSIFRLSTDCGWIVLQGDLIDESRIPGSNQSPERRKRRAELLRKSDWTGQIKMKSQGHNVQRTAHERTSSGATSVRHRSHNLLINDFHHGILDSEETFG